MEASQHVVAVIGHKNPDSDSVCSAIAYAALKNATSDRKYEARRAGELNKETAFILNYFGVPVPRLCLDVNPKIRNVDYRHFEGVPGNVSLSHAWKTMHSQDIGTLPVVDEENNLLGLVSMRDIMAANMDDMDTGVLAKSRTPYVNILQTLNGRMVVGSADKCVEQGNIFVGAGSPEMMEESLHPGDIVILSNRYESQACAIMLGVSLIIVCNDAPVSSSIRALAEQNHVDIISAPGDTYSVSKRICQSPPVSYIMQTTDIIKFSRLTLVDDALKAMAKVRFTYFPILDADGKYCGMVSRRNIINMPRRQMILVDHNEATQSVEGTDRAEILEIIDHHRIGRPQTDSPIYFRNQPVGCTATIVTQMYREYDQPIPRQIAGLLLSAILSDTLVFRSPTCTELDRRTANMLAELAQVDIGEFSAKMFEAGEQITGKAPKDLVMQDFKVFLCGETRFGVGQINFMTEQNLHSAQELIRPYLKEALHEQNVEDIYMLLTNVPKTESTVICTGINANQILSDAFDIDATDDIDDILPGVISRKKQFLPAVMSAYQQL